MSKLLIEERSIVVPGEPLASGMDYLPGDGSFREGDNILSNRFGLFNTDGRLMKVIPLRGKYIPKKGDNIIGVVTDVTNNLWRVNFGWAFLGSILLKDGSRDYIQTNIEGYSIELIPILNIKEVSEAENITDISPFHKRWVKQFPKYSNDIRLAKAFAQVD